MVTAKRFKPAATVSFYTENGEIVARTKPKTQGDKINSDILSITTTNDLEADAGTFQISLVSRNRWDKVLASNDLLFIDMWRDEDDKDNSTVMIGLIDDVRKSTAIQGETIQRMVNVTGRTFAKALINFEVGVVQEVNLTTDSLGWLEGRVSFMGQSAANIAKQIMNVLVYKYTNYKFHNGKTLEDLVKLDFTSRSGEHLFDDKSFINYQGSINSFMREIVDEPFNQMFWETYNNKATYVIRETPFNKENWQKLTTHKINDSDVISDSTGRSDIESYALFSVGLQNYFNGFDVSKTINVFPLWNEDYYHKYGLKRLNRFTGFVGFGNSSDTDVQSKLEKYQEDLYNWNIFNPIFYNGDLMVRGENRYKIGDRLLYDSEEDNRTIEYFIESVYHEFINFDHWTTRISVTRGMENSGKGRFDKPWGTGKKFEGGALGTPSVSDIQITGADVNAAFPQNFGQGTALAQEIIAYAETFIGKVKYKMGAGRNTTDILLNHFDCSSFVRYVYAQNGVNLGSIYSTTSTLVKQGIPVGSIFLAKPGDLVFFNTYKKNGHVGIYLGADKFIGAQEKGVNIQDIAYWDKTYGIGDIRRVLF